MKKLTLVELYETMLVKEYKFAKSIEKNKNNIEILKSIKDVHFNDYVYKIVGTSDNSSKKISLVVHHKDVEFKQLNNFSILIIDEVAKISSKKKFVCTVVDFYRRILEETNTFDEEFESKLLRSELTLDCSKIENKLKK